MLPATVASAEPTTEQQLDKAYDELEHVIEDYNRIGEELKAAQAAAADIEQKLGGLQAKVDATQSEVGKFAVTAYKGGGNLSATRFLLDADDSASMARQVAAMERVSRSRQRDIAGFAAARSQFEAEKKQLADLISAQTQQRAALAAKKAAIEAEIKRLEAIEAGLRTTKPTQTQTPGSSSPPPGSSGKGAIAVQYAYAQLGKMYLYGAAGPERFDCSGLTQQAWKRAGVNLPHNAAQQHQRTAKVTRAQLQPGDLVYYNGFGHVGIYVGNNQIIHASRASQPVALRGIQSPIAYSRPG
ncbi:C40 family peptidase [Virgisporangium ochraceum]|nr:C40 family peptidase [Virgisporangium ochraceum]